MCGWRSVLISVFIKYHPDKAISLHIKVEWPSRLNMCFKTLASSRSSALFMDFCVRFYTSLAGEVP